MLILSSVSGDVFYCKREPCDIALVSVNFVKLAGVWVIKAEKTDTVQTWVVDLETNTNNRVKCAVNYGTINSTIYAFYEPWGRLSLLFDFDKSIAIRRESTLVLKDRLAFFT